MSDALAIVAMNEGDLAGIAAIETGSSSTSTWDEASLRAELDRTWAQLWGIRDAGVPIAFVLTWIVQDELHILNVATHPGHRRHGYARRLLAHAVAYGHERGVRRVILEVRLGNTPAITLYRAFGMVAFNRRARYYSDGEDALEMGATLDDAGLALPAVDDVRVD